MSVQIFSSAVEMSETAARFFVETSRTAIRESDRFTVALAGGSSPRKMYELLASESFADEVPWEKTFVFWGDERFVPSDDPENNARMARKKLLDHVPIPEEHIFPIPTDGNPNAAADRYASALASFFESKLPRFDLILLGLGANGHTASLFPGTNVLDEKDEWTGTIFLAGKNQHRITLTAPVINNAKHIAFLVYGEDKAETVANVIQGPHQPETWPAQLIEPSDGSVDWFLDEAAAEQLEGH